MKKRDDANKPNSSVKNLKRRRIYWAVAIIIIALAVLLFTTKLYLTINLLLGNDIVIKLSSDKDNLNLVQGQSDTIEFDSLLLTNPFCSAECVSEFADLSTGETIELENFTLAPALKKAKTFTIQATKSEKGQELYRFDIKCRGIQTFLCHTTSEQKQRSVLVTLNYDLNEESLDRKNDLMNGIKQMIQGIDEQFFEIETINLNLNSSIDTNYFYLESQKISQELGKINNTAYNLKSSWESQEYSSIDLTNADIGSLNERLSALNQSLVANISGYNKLIDELNSDKAKLEQLKSINVTNLGQIDSAIDSFNTAINLFDKKSALETKQNITGSISAQIDLLNITSEENATLASNLSLADVPEKLAFIQLNYTAPEITFKEPVAICCLHDKCENCCQDCPDIYPVILIHGHAFNKAISAEYSIDTFQDIQNSLENDSYINAGLILISPSEEEAGIWSKLNEPVSVRASYYFDVYKNPKTSSVIQTKSDSLDTYAIRLRDIIDIAKYKTGKEKVILVTHSMGGLVARRYLDIFGSDDVDKLIMVASPNHGIDPSIQRLCSLFGEALECRDMAQDSLFINKLSYSELPDIPLYNIIGTGCKMGNETGDGIVAETSAYLKGAENFKVEGKCEGLSFLHEKLLNPSEYPEVYRLIVQNL